MKIIDDLVQQLKTEFIKRGHAFFEKGRYNVNIVGIRTADKTDWNQFDDELLLVYKDDFDHWKIKTYSITTIPGVSILQNPVNTKGTAVVVPGQYPGVWEIGLHKGKYKALVQTGNQIEVYRYKDGKIVGREFGYFGINCHKAGSHSVEVGGWSAGCQVFQMESEFNSFFHIIEKSAALYGPRFTYTLLD